MVRPLALLISMMACAGPGSPAPPTGAPSPATAISDAGTKPAPPPPATPISEAHARQIITRALRDAGLRVLYDVPLEVGGRQLTLDGYASDRGIGFEYTAPEEREVNGAAPDTGDDVHILWLPPSSEDVVRERTREFVAEHLPADAGAEQP